MFRSANDSSKTFFIDIDGTLLYQNPKSKQVMDHQVTLKLPGAEKIREWYEEGHVIILTTARPSNYRNLTELQLKAANIPYDQLIMDIGRNTRILVNNKSSHYPEQRRAVAYEVEKNVGIGDIDE